MAGGGEGSAGAHDPGALSPGSVPRAAVRSNHSPRHKRHRPELGKAHWVVSLRAQTAHNVTGHTASAGHGSPLASAPNVTVRRENRKVLLSPDPARLTKTGKFFHKQKQPKCSHEETDTETSPAESLDDLRRRVRVPRGSLPPATRPAPARPWQSRGQEASPPSGRRSLKRCLSLNAHFHPN